MSDRDPELTPEQEARLRRLLVDARHGDPIPVDVAARLDRVLEQLAAEGPDEIEPRGASVDDLTARRRRRVTTVLVAAAAVVVLAVGVGRVVRATDSGDSAESASVPAAASDDAAENGQTAKNGDGAGSAGPPGPQSFSSSGTAVGPNDSGEPAQTTPPVRLTQARFAEQVVRYRGRVSYYALADGVRVGVDQLGAPGSFLCAAADWGPGALLAASYDGVPTVLAYRAPAGTTQTVELLRCGTAEVLRSTVLATR